MLEDLAIVYKVLVNKDETGTGTIPVTNSHMEYWGLTEEQLYETAIKNSNMFEPPFIDDMDRVAAEMLRERGMTEEEIEEFQADVHPKMYIISNASKVNGASAIVYSDALQQVAEMMGSDLYILPSSIHEVLAVSVEDRELEDLEEMVRSVNQTDVSPEEVLSDNVYKYDSESRTLSLASEKAERIHEAAVCEPSEYIKAIGSFSLDNAFAIRGIRVMEDSKGRNFVAFPSRERSNGDYEDIAFPLSKEFYHKITDAIMTEFNRMREEVAAKVSKADQEQKETASEEQTQKETSHRGKGR